MKQRIKREKSWLLHSAFHPVHSLSKALYLSMIAIIDYGMGNLRSVQKGFERMGHEAVVTSDAKTILRRLEGRPARRGRLPGLHAEPP